MLQSLPSQVLKFLLLMQQGIYSKKPKLCTVTDLVQCMCLVLLVICNFWIQPNQLFISAYRKFYGRVVYGQVATRNPDPKQQNLQCGSGSKVFSLKQGIRHQ